MRREQVAPQPEVAGQRRWTKDLPGKERQDSDLITIMKARQSLSAKIFIQNIQRLLHS